MLRSIPPTRQDTQNPSTSASNQGAQPTTNRPASSINERFQGLPSSPKPKASHNLAKGGQANALAKQQINPDSTDSSGDAIRSELDRASSAEGSSSTNINFFEPAQHTVPNPPKPTAINHESSQGSTVPDVSQTNPFTSGILNNAQTNPFTSGILNNTQTNPFTSGIFNNAQTNPFTSGVLNNSQTNPFASGTLNPDAFEEFRLEISHPSLPEENRNLLNQINKFLEENPNIQKENPQFFYNLNNFASNINILKDIYSSLLESKSSKSTESSEKQNLVLGTNTPVSGLTPPANNLSNSIPEFTLERLLKFLESTEANDTDESDTEGSQSDIEEPVQNELCEGRSQSQSAAKNTSPNANSDPSVTPPTLTNEEKERNSIINQILDNNQGNPKIYENNPKKFENLGACTVAELKSILDTQLTAIMSGVGQSRQAIIPTNHQQKPPVPATHYQQQAQGYATHHQHPPAHGYAPPYQFYPPYTHHYIQPQPYIQHIHYPVAQQGSFLENLMNFFNPYAGIHSALQTQHAMQMNHYLNYQYPAHSWQQPYVQNFTHQPYVTYQPTGNFHAGRAY
ncbi:MAG: hypothetical protein ON057_001871 [Glomeribacter sp. 1016415]|nr:hypothetical protein [Glomeribacter sp. 1016415]